MPIDCSKIVNAGLAGRKKFYKFTALMTLSCTVIAGPVAGETLIQDKHKVDVATFVSPAYKPGLVRHIVLFRYRESITQQQLDEIQHLFLALKTTAQRQGHPYIRTIETGKQISGENTGHGMEQAFIVTFNSEGDRNYYVGTPVVKDPAYYDAAHADFKRHVAPYLSDILVFDYAVEAKDAR